MTIYTITQFRRIALFNTERPTVQWHFSGQALAKGPLEIIQVSSKPVASISKGSWAAQNSLPVERKKKNCILVLRS